MSKFLLPVTSSELASDVAALINAGQQLCFRQTSYSILSNSTTYLIKLHLNKVVGVIGLEQCSNTVTELKHLCVDPEYRGRGIGLSLLKEGVIYASTPYVFGKVGSDNAVNIRNNLRAGFKPIAKVRGRNRYIIIFARRKNGRSKQNILYNSNRK